MSHTFYIYLASQLDKMLRDDRVVVFYDPRGEFSPFIDELEVVETGLGGLTRVSIGETLTYIARFEGSFFSLKSAIEPVVGADKPEPMLVFIPGVERDREASVLMELECAGKCYEPQLRRLARNQMRKHFTDGDIDDMLAPESLTYQDVVHFLDQSDSDSSSLVKLVLGNGSSEVLLSKWLARGEHDETLEAKLAQPELYKLVNSRLGLEIDSGASLTKARHQTLRYILVNEFRADLASSPPDGLSLISEPATKECQQRVGEVAAILRTKYGDSYIGIADSLEQELNLASAVIDPATLGAIDTFRFEERQLLGYAASLTADGNYAKALDVVSDRGHSFWVDDPSFLDRLAQWEACRLMAELESLVQQVRPKVKKMAGGASKWVEAYGTEGGWYRVDLAQRILEAWVAKMEDEPEESLERALNLVRRNHETLLNEMALGFTEALIGSCWTVPGVLLQTNIYPELVEPCGGRVAYFFVDAMRFEMGADLIEQLQGAQELRLQPAVSTLPSITTMGMAALLPKASASFTVIEHNGKLASKVDGRVLPGVRERLRLLKAVRPDAVDIRLDDLLHWASSRVNKRLGDAPLVVVRSQEIDAFGESGLEHLTRQVMNSIIGNISRAVRKLSKLGIQRFVITSDHGHQFSIRKTDDMMMDKPGGDTVDQHRRFWAGRGGKTSGAAVRVSGAQLSYQTNLDFIFPRGLAVFHSGGDLTFHHGGISLQEMVIPVITLRMSTSKAESGSHSKITIEGYPKVLTNRTFGFRLVHLPDIFQETPVVARVVLVGDGQEVGRAGMAPNAEFDLATATVHLPPGEKVGIGMMLTTETSKKVRIVVQDPTTDAVLAQSEEIKVGDLI